MLRKQKDLVKRIKTISMNCPKTYQKNETRPSTERNIFTFSQWLVAAGSAPEHPGWRRQINSQNFHLHLPGKIGVCQQGPRPSQQKEGKRYPLEEDLTERREVYQAQSDRREKWVFLEFCGV